jgi:hypothetical protein
MVTAIKLEYNIEGDLSKSAPQRQRPAYRENYKRPSGNPTTIRPLLRSISSTTLSMAGSKISG